MLRNERFEDCSYLLRSNVAFFLIEKRSFRVPARKPINKFRINKKDLSNKSSVFVYSSYLRNDGAAPNDNRSDEPKKLAKHQFSTVSRFGPR